MNTPTVRVADAVDTGRAAVVDADTLPAVVGQWLRADGIAARDYLADGVTPNVRALAAALRRRNWAAVHALADRLSLTVEAV
jgi:hypothetical protein